MTRYRISEDPSAISIQLTEVAGHQKELLEAFQECQDGSCACPTDEYKKVASMAVDINEGGIAIRLEGKPGTNLDTSEIARCLDYTTEKIAAARK